MTNSDIGCTMQYKTIAQYTLAAAIMLATSGCRVHIGGLQIGSDGKDTNGNKSKPAIERKHDERPATPTIERKLEVSPPFLFPMEDAELAQIRGSPYQPSDKFYHMKRQALYHR
jgi:hypothetical protein